MIISDNLLEQIAQQNLDMLFAKGTFKVRFEHMEEKTSPSGKHRMGRILMRIHKNDLHEELLNVTLEIRVIPSRNLMNIIGYEFYCEDVNDTFLDFVKCVKEIQDKINSLSTYSTIYYEGPDSVVVNFNEIGIESLVGDESRDLIVKRNGDISYITFDDKGLATTKPMTEEEFKAMIIQYLSDDNKLVDFCGATQIMFVDYDRYENADIKDTDDME